MTGRAIDSHAAEIPVRGRDLGRDVIDAIMREAQAVIRQAIRSGEPIPSLDPNGRRA